MDALSGTRPRRPESMRAVVLEHFGGPKRLRVGTVLTPVPERGEVLVRVHAAGVNPVDAQNRQDGAWAGLELPAVLGSDFSGVIEGLGEGVTGWEVGQEVFGVSPFRHSRLGTYAEYHVAPAVGIAPKPGTLDHIQAAAIPLAACTAYAVVHERLAVGPGESLLIHGAAGGVGCYAVQLARSIGARVLAVSSKRHHELLRELGAEVCIDYASEDLVEAVGREAPGGVHAVADFVGGDALSRSLSVLRTRGRAATIVGLDGDLDLAIDLNATLHCILLDPGNVAPLRAVTEQVERGLVRPVVSKVFSLEHASDAHRIIEGGHVQGKIVLRLT